MIRRVEAVLRRSYDKNVNNYLVFKEVRIDVDAYRVYVNDVEILLTTKEFEILQLLFQNERKVLTRENIVEKVGDTIILEKHE